LLQTYKRRRALQPLPGLHIACHSALAADASESCLGQVKRPSEHTTPNKLLGQCLLVRPGPDPACFQSTPVHRTGSCFEPYVSVDPRRRGLDAVGPGPSVLANSSSVLTPAETCTGKRHSQYSGDAAGMVFQDAAQHSLLPQLHTGSLGSSVNTLHLTSLEPSCSSLLDHSLAKDFPQEGYGIDASPCAGAGHCASNTDQPSTCLSHSPPLQPALGMDKRRLTSCPTIITDGAHILEVSPRSLVTPRNSRPPSALCAQHPPLRKESSTPLRTADNRMLPSSSYAGAGRYRRHIESPSDDEASDSPSLSGGLLTPQCMSTVPVLECMSPAEHQLSVSGSAGSGSAGRLVCNLIERFNNTQLYDGITESPQLAAAQLVYPGSD
jgi:hypothetical protein